MATTGEVPRAVLLYNAGILAMDNELRQYNSGAILIKGDRIADIGRADELLRKYRNENLDEMLDLEGRWILPGFVNTHVHTSQQLGRGIADDVDLLTWLHERIWPYEAAMTEQDSYVSTLLCGIELIRSGVTCFAEAGGQHVPGMARAVKELGIRACLCQSAMDSGDGLPVAWAKRTSAQCIQDQEELFRQFNGTVDGRIRVWLGLRQILNSTDELLQQTKATADRLHTGIHMHVAELQFENEHIVQTRGCGGTVKHLAALGLLDANLLAAHSVWLDDTDVSLFAGAHVKVSHCPGPAMRMLGFSPVPRMLEQGVCVALGSDGAPSNNRMSIVDDMYLASLIMKGRAALEGRGSTDPTALPAQVVLQMATIHGARAVLWEDEVGSLEVGKKADLCVIDPRNWTMQPMHDPVASMVYCMRTENIQSVMCNGRWIMRDGVILTVNEADVISMAKGAASSLLERAGIHLPPRMRIMD